MKIKYIFSMIAGLFVLVTTSCSEKKPADSGEAKPKTEKEADKKTEEKSPESEEAAPDAAAPAADAPSAYYVMFKGDGG